MSRKDNPISVNLDLHNIMPVALVKRLTVRKAVKEYNKSSKKKDSDNFFNDIIGNNNQRRDR